MKKGGILIKDSVVTKEHDSSQVRLEPTVLNHRGAVVSQPAKARKDLVEDLLILLQNTLNDKVSSTTYTGRLDQVQNTLFELKAYSGSLKEAATAIMTAYPVEDDKALNDVCSLCDTLHEGIGIVNQYMEAAKKFGDDLDKIRDEFNTQIATLFQEI